MRPRSQKLSPRYLCGVGLAQCFKGKASQQAIYHLQDDHYLLFTSRWLVGEKGHLMECCYLSRCYKKFIEIQVDRKANHLL